MNGDKSKFLALYEREKIKVEERLSYALKMDTNPLSHRKLQHLKQTVTALLRVLRSIVVNIKRRYPIQMV